MRWLSLNQNLDFDPEKSLRIASTVRLLFIGWIGLAFPLLVFPSPKIGALVAAVGLALAIVLFITDRGNHAKKTVSIGPLVLAFALCALAVLSLISAIWSPEPGFTAARAIQFVGGLAVAVALLAIWPNTVAERISSLFAIAVPVAFLTMATDWYLGSPIVLALGLDNFVAEYNRPFLHLVLFAAVAIAAGPARWLVFLNIGVVVTISVLTESQATQVGIVFGVVAATVVYFSRPVGLALLSGLFAAVVIVLPWVIAPLSGFANDSLGFALSNTAAIRVEIWAHLAGQLRDVLPLGIGFETTRFGPEVGIVTLPDGTTREIAAPFHPHSFSLQVLYELGFAGMICVLAAGLAAIYAMRDWQPRILAPAVFIFVVLLVTASLATSAWQAWRIGLVAVLAAVLIDLARTTSSPNSQSE